jgi:hypothetical protein
MMEYVKTTPRPPSWSLAVIIWRPFHLTTLASGPTRMEDTMPRIRLRDSRLWSLPLLILALLLQFAAAAAAQQPGYHYGWHGAPAMNRQEQKNTSQKEAYDKYKLKKEQANLEREKKGLEPRPIVTFEEWKQGMR